MATETDLGFMRKAIALAATGKATAGGGAFGAVITKDKAIIAAVHNQVKGQQDCTQHAELRAIQTACTALKSSDLSECILYTSCEPCMMCLGAAYWAGFKAIFYGASAADAKKADYLYSDMYYASANPERHKEFNMRQLLQDEAVAVWND